MGKRGLGDVDWIIASGLFLVSLVTLLVFIKPGIIPLHSSDSLLDIIEDSFKKDLIAENGKLAGGVYWTVYQTPIFLKKEALSGEKCIALDFPYTDISSSKMRIYNDTGRLDSDAVPFKIISGNPGKLKFKANLNSQGDDKNIYYIYSSNNELYEGLNNNLDDVLDCNGDIYEDEITNPDGSKTINFVYEYGVTENLKGISRKMVDYLEDHQKDQQVYNLLKNIYSYPKLKEFALSITNDIAGGCAFNPQAGDTQLNCDFQPINPGDANVYTRSWSDFVLDYNGVRYPFTITIKVW